MSAEYLGRDAVPAPQLGGWPGWNRGGNRVDSDHNSGDGHHGAVDVGDQHQRRDQRR